MVTDKLKQLAQEKRYEEFWREILPILVANQNKALSELDSDLKQLITEVIQNESA